MKFYRYEDALTTMGVRINECEFRLVKETPKGYWITYDWDLSNECKKWVSKDGEKRFAYPTKAEAKYSFLRRKEAQVAILNRQLDRAETALAKAAGNLDDSNTAKVRYSRMFKNYRKQNRKQNGYEYIKKEEMHV
jgi:hypothetical protein